MKGIFSFPKLIYIMLFFAAVCILLNFVTPPFQNPDEPQHLGVILTYSLGNEKEEFIEKEIIRLMDKNFWWKYVGMGRPEILPEKLSENEFLMDYNNIQDYKIRLNKIIFYHFLLGKVLGIIAKDNVILSYYLCRLFSVFFILGSLFLMYLTFRKISDITDNYFLYGFFFILFLPQFETISIAVNPDAFSFFLSSLFFYASFSLIIEKLRIKYFVFLILSAGLGLLTDRSVFPLILLSALVPLFLIKRKNYKNYSFHMLAFFLLFILLIALLSWIFPVQVDNSLSTIKTNFIKKISGIPRIFSLNKFNQEFFALLADSFLLKFGWMAFSAQKIFYYVWRLFIVFAFAGIIIYLGKSIYTRVVKSDSILWNIKLKIVVFSLIAILFQIVGLWTFYGTSQILVQGRYLFPVIIPIAFLFLLGMKTLFDLFHKKGGLISIGVFVACEFLFFNFIVWNYMIPVFHLIVKAAHPGI